MSGSSQLRCASCGERIKVGRGPTGFTHVSRVTAACDLNADHFPEPDPVLLGRVVCRVCGGAVEWGDRAFVHAGGGGDDHDPDPELPLL